MVTPDSPDQSSQPTPIHDPKLDILQGASLSEAPRVSDNFRQLSEDLPISREHLERYIDTALKVGVNLQPGQPLCISGDIIHRELADLIADKARREYGSPVVIDLSNPIEDRIAIMHARDQSDLVLPPSVSERTEALVEAGAAFLTFSGPSDPLLFSDLNSEFVSKRIAELWRARQSYRDEVVGQGNGQWSGIGAPTPGWAKMVYPEMSLSDAYKELWKDVVKINRLDQPDSVEAWQEHIEKLASRKALLNSLNIESLHFSGPGTDLIVGLSEKYNFLGGALQNTSGVNYVPNMPTEEVFTTPDSRKTSGHVTITRPVLINGKSVEGLHLEFVDGRLESFAATKNADAFQALIDTDEGGRFLGEVALVGIDSPIFQTGNIFHSILFDENAACHIAVGRCYPMALQGGTEMSQEELVQEGGNFSEIHTDLMISSEEVSVKALTRDGDEVSLIENGAWVV